ncbi:von Willebrand factor A domain-containing protein 7 [Collichthys lucidus]|uniref:von Willebrand factor A domain-containing protein 7 n=1 Tax=Collichthys lucidus TaxID=240159 RepID=A0A4U5V6A4_COLLU|nr:von Willebrand factor A domain-containing protein 7 [Collichthys lucidus]
MSGGLAVLCLLLLQTGAFGFQIIFGGGSLKHQDITERAIFNATVQACRALALAEGRDFTFPDFYSHSNWVEMENIFPNSNLIRSDTSIGNIAAKSRATCRNCDGDNCRKNILEDILQEKILTSGYFSLLPFFATKPEGKCSHGGTFDQTSGIEPKGGINKDKLTSEHGHLHVKAANLAIAATSELLEDIRGAAGDRPFLQMLGISRGSNKALCFVIDTTGSMSDDIAAVRTVTSSIINSRVGTQDEPSVYILVPFNDPDFGPLTRTTDPNVFKNAINSLTATGGGDLPEMSLSGLQLALTGSPPNSEIFVFTDADAKDTHLRGTVIALIERTQSVVPLLQVARGPGKNQNFTFTVDESVGNLTIYITGTSVNFTLISPSGESQQSTNMGSLITSSRFVGNFKTLLLKTQVGLWEIKIVSANAHTLKVVAESSIDFLFDFLEVSQSLLGVFDVVDNRPRAVTEVILVKSSGSGQVNGSVKAQGGADFLAHFDVIPSEDFVVVVKGRNINSSTRALPVFFQRQSPTSIRASTLSVTADDSNNVLVPGIPLSVPFTVTTNGTGADFSIQATNDQGFTSNFPSTLSLVLGGSANGTVNLTAPPNTVSGTEVTLTVEAQAPGGTDTNYVVLRFTVLTTVTDFTRPVCDLVSLQSNCSENCSLSMWELSVQVTDGAEGTGIDRITLKQGNGTMSTSLAAGNENITLVSYDASYCSPNVELLVVDRVGNVGSCFYSIRRTVTNNNSLTSQYNQQPTNYT